MALKANRRKFAELILQETSAYGAAGGDGAGGNVKQKKESTMRRARSIHRLAKQLAVPVVEMPKHDLNMMAVNRPHQGYILRAEPLDFTPISELAAVNTASSAFAPTKHRTSNFVLALDEVWDPQNFGALLRTAHFLGVSKVVVCAKNSAPLSPAVSKASAGAMEAMEVYSTKTMMSFLDKSKKNGWKVLRVYISAVKLFTVSVTVVHFVHTAFYLTIYRNQFSTPCSCRVKSLPFAHYVYCPLWTHCFCAYAVYAVLSKGTGCRYGRPISCFGQHS